MHRQQLRGRFRFCALQVSTPTPVVGMLHTEVHIVEVAVQPTQCSEFPLTYSQGGVRISAKRQKSPLVLSPEEVILGLAQLEFRDQLLVFVDDASHGLLPSPPEKRTYHVLSQPDISCANDGSHCFS